MQSSTKQQCERPLLDPRQRRAVRTMPKAPQPTIGSSLASTPPAVPRSWAHGHLPGVGAVPGRRGVRPPSTPYRSRGSCPSTTQNQ
eukprot:9581831-Lingulodinium_polyedra.AAC.1